MNLIKLTFGDGDIYINADRISAIWTSVADGGYNTIVCADGDNYHVKEVIADVLAAIDALKTP